MFLMIDDTCPISELIILHAHHESMCSLSAQHEIMSTLLSANCIKLIKVNMNVTFVVLL